MHLKKNPRIILNWYIKRTIKQKMMKHIFKIISIYYYSLKPTSDMSLVGQKIILYLQLDFEIEICNINRLWDLFFFSHKTWKLILYLCSYSMHIFWILNVFFFFLNMYYFFQIIVVYFSITVLELPGIVKTILNMLFLKRFRNQFTENYIFQKLSHFLCFCVNFNYFL